MDYKVISRWGWSQNTFYYSVLRWAETYAKAVRRDGGEATLYVRDGKEWRELCG